MLKRHKGWVCWLEISMRSFLINKNLCFYYWLKKKIGKKWALGVANGIEKTILIFGRDIMPYFNRNGMFIEEQE
jgi:hypothetical protein